MGKEHNKIPAEQSKIKQKEAAPMNDALNIKKYIKIGVIGRGGFGKVTEMTNIGMEDREQEGPQPLRTKGDVQSKVSSIVFWVLFKKSV